MKRPKSDTTTGVERAEGKQTREHTHTEQLKTVANTIDTGDENKDVTPMVMTHDAKSERDYDRLNEPRPNAQPKEGRIGNSEAAA